VGYERLGAWWWSGNRGGGKGTVERSKCHSLAEEGAGP